MVRRRFHYDCLATVNEPRWLKVFDKLSNVLSCRELLPNMDLRAELRAVAKGYAADGWRIEGDGAEHWTGNFFMNRDGDRWFVAIMPSEKPDPGHGIN
ncbi:MAG: hypothetical protein ABW278_03995 [Steroidobacteraceae bacterium]